MNNLLDVLFALVITGGIVAVGLPQVIAMQTQPAQNDAGNQIAQMQAAGASYVKNHAAALIASVPVGGNTAVTPAMLVADGDLPTTFVDQNVFGQQHILIVAQLPAPYPAGTLDGMVYTYGGDQAAVTDNIAIRVAQAGPANATVLLSSDLTNFEGAAGGAIIPTSYYANATYPIAQGHFGAHIVPASYAAEAPFLNRYNTGNLDDNTMHTAQYMAGNNLEMGTSAAATAGGGNIDMAGGNVNAATQVTATQQVNTPTVADITNPAYQMTMAGTSRLNTVTVTANETVGTTGNGNNLTVNGNVIASTYLHTSDRRLKENIRPITNSDSLIERLSGYFFNWREGGQRDLGFVAQDVQKVIPEAVKETPNGMLAVKYDVMAAPLTESMKNRIAVEAQQAKEIEALRHQVEDLQRRIPQAPSH